MNEDLFGGLYIGLNYQPPPIKPHKGEYMGHCNRRACQKPGAIWLNHSTQSFYCKTCALEINRWNPEGLNGSPICEEITDSKL